MTKAKQGGPIKESWSQKLKREKAELQTENMELKERLLSLDTKDNIFTAAELKTIKFFKFWFWLTIFAVGFRLSYGYITGDWCFPF